MSNFTEEVIKTSLRDMFKKGWVNVCTIDKCLKLAGAMPPRQAYDEISALHCVNFRDMNPEFREEVCWRILELFKFEDFSNELRAAVGLPKRGIVRRITDAVRGSDRHSHRE